MRRTVTRGLSLLVGAVLILSGCAGEVTPASPSPDTGRSTGSGAGVWSGSVSDPVEGEGAVRLSLSEQPAGPNGVATPGALVGTWAFTFRNGASVAGRAEGHLGGTNNFGLILWPEPLQDCQGRPGSSGLAYYSLVKASVTSSRITAALNRATCAGLSVGSVNLARQ